jgi:hypothetical protein
MPRKSPQWKAKLNLPEPRPIRQEEIYLLCQILPPDILALITNPPREDDVKHSESPAEAPTDWQI